MHHRYSFIAVCGLLWLNCTSAQPTPSVSKQVVQPTALPSAPTANVEDASADNTGLQVDASGDAIVDSAPAIPSLEEALRQLKEAGYPALASFLEGRVRQTKPKNKLEPEQAAAAALYCVVDLPRLPNAKQLASVMPKTTVELVRSLHEREVPRAVAEAMAEYLFRLREALQLGNPGPFDENCSHLIGKEWHQIDYRGEGLTWQNQKRVYESKGVRHFKNVENLQRFFRVESKAEYFQKLYQPAGTVP